MKTRQEYLDGKCTHREYYRQFVNEKTKEAVLNRYKIEELKEGTPFEKAALAAWDSLGNYLSYDHELCAKIKEAGDYLTAAGAVCIMKEAARQLID